MHLQLATVSHAVTNVLQRGYQLPRFTFKRTITRNVDARGLVKSFPYLCREARGLGRTPLLTAFVRH